jgi:glycogen debranching enzyme
MHRQRRGQCRRETRETSVRIVYRGLDGRDRVSLLRLGHSISAVSEDAVVFEVAVGARQAARVCFCVDFREPEDGHGPQNRFDAALGMAIERFRGARQSAAHIHTSNEQFNQWLSRSFSDVHLLATEAATGLYPYAGVPWFSAPFGRDGIITARELLTVEPQLARGVLGYLAERQATEEEPERDAEPGKILHEARLGEMAALGEIPFGRYYGSIDSTPLFLMLAGDYLRRSGDVEFIRSIWPNLAAAAEWLRVWGDSDGDGLIEYLCHAETGLRNQGWKDSEDSVSHADGRLAEGAIAPCEVQAYAYAALLAAGRIAAVLGNGEEAKQYEGRAERMRARFEEAFWRPRLGTYALALDGQKRPCDVRASNAGHALWAGIASAEHAAGVVEALLAPSTFNGWGVRTLDEREARYNPMSYHNGSIWPHDNALIALGLARYGYKVEALRVMTGLFDASIFMPMHRLPELFCGFERRDEEGPTLYPVACLPQAWASGAVFALLEAATGLSLSIDGPTGRPMVRFAKPVLPPYLEHVRMTNLRVGDEEVDLELHRYETEVGVQMVRRSPRVGVVITK